MFPRTCNLYIGINLTVCPLIFTGDECNVDFDGCAATPCSLGRECTDVSAADHLANGKAFTCAGCPDGYTANAEDNCDGKLICHNYLNCIMADIYP